MALLQSLTIAAGLFHFPRGKKMEYKKTKRATIKERRAVADILAIKEGYTQRQQKHIDAAAALSDSDIFRILEENTPAAVEVEEIGPDELPADLYSVCENIINEFCNKYGLDAFKLSPLQWGAACSSVGRWFRSRSAFRVPSSNFIQGSNKKIDAAAVAGMVPVWRDLCGLYNQIPLIDDFCMLAGLSYEWLWKIKEGNGVTSDDIQLYKTIKDASRAGLNKRLVDSKGAQVGAIFYAKAVEGYQETTNINHTYENSNKTAAALPTFGAYDAIEDKNPQK